MWPSKSKYVKTKRRCLFGIRLKQDLGYSPSNTRQASTAFPRRVSLDSLSSQSTSKSKTPLPPGIKNNRRRDKFTPYYDILENNHCYVIRVVLPLMDEGDAKGITFDCNMAKKSLNVSGSYIPGCHIGHQVIQQFGIQSPLLSVIHSPTHTTGWFDIHIPLPTDVRKCPQHRPCTLGHCHLLTTSQDHRLSSDQFLILLWISKSHEGVY